MDAKEYVEANVGRPVKDTFGHMGIVCGHYGENAIYIESDIGYDGECIAGTLLYPAEKVLPRLMEQLIFLTAREIVGKYKGRQAKSIYSHFTGEIYDFANDRVGLRCENIITHTEVHNIRMLNSYKKNDTQKLLPEPIDDKMEITKRE
jgi:hypothetical protein